MSDSKSNSKEENFADLLARSAMDTGVMEPGQALETEIVAIAGDSIFLQLNGKSEGVLPAEEMTDKEGNLTVKEGDTIKVFFLKSEQGEMRFTTRISANEAGQAVLKEAYEKGIPVEGVVEKEIKGGFQVRVGEARAFCPFSQMGERRVEDPAVWVGKHLTFKITEHSERGRNIIVSNRAILEEEMAAKREELSKTLEVGMTVTGTVKSVRDFGAFVDLSGIQALLPISEIAHARVDDIESVLEVDQQIEVQIIRLDWKNDRISVSMKALAGDPWDEARSKYREGSVHEGRVARITDFGAFVTLEPGIDGLIHVSEFKEDGRSVRPRDAVQKGQEIHVRVSSVDEVRKRISLKPVGEDAKDEDFSSYMGSSSSGETYNPFAALLKDKMKK